MTTPNDADGAKDPLADFKLYLARWETENTLINQRLTWLLTSQGLLFAAYGTLAVKAFDACQARAEFLLKTLDIAVIAGKAFSVVIWVGIAAAIVAQIYLHRKRPSPREEIGVKTGTTIAGWVTCLMIPTIFLVAWFYIETPQLLATAPVCQYTPAIP